MNCFPSPMARCAILLAGLAAGPLQAQENILDPSYSGDGRQTVSFDQGGGNNDRPVDAIRTNILMTVLVGNVTSAAGNRVGLVRLDLNGNLSPGLGVDGTRILDLCMDVAVRDAFYSTGSNKIYVLGETITCSVDGTRDGRIARLLADGSPDPTFGVDGALSFRLQDGEQTVDRVFSMLEDASNGQIVVAGSVVSQGQGLERPVAVRLTGAGVNAVVFGPQSSDNGRLVDVQRVLPSGYLFLFQRDGNALARSGGFFRLDIDFMPVGTFGSFGFVGIADSGVQIEGGCSADRRLVLRRLATTLGHHYILGDDGFPSNSLAYASVAMAGGAGRALRCGGPGIVVQAALADDINEAASVYVAGSCPLGRRTAMCVQRLLKRIESPLLDVDPTFNSAEPGAALSVEFPADQASEPSSEAVVVQRRNGRTLLLGSRRWSGSDRDFAAAQFFPAPSLLRDGFE